MTRLLRYGALALAAGSSLAAAADGTQALLGDWPRVHSAIAVEPALEARVA